MPRQILFLCTGNYYRSRFAEILFNVLAQKAGIDYVASSRALALELGIFNVGALSIYARRGLKKRGIPIPQPIPYPKQCEHEDLENAYLVIALKEAEHRRYLAERYPDWPDRVRYWHVHDLDKSRPQQALAEIEINVVALVRDLASETPARQK